MAIGVTATLEYELGSGWAAINNVKSISFPGFNVGTVDTTHLGLSDYAMTFDPGMVDAGVMTFECKYTDAQYEVLQGLIRDVVGWRIGASEPEANAIICDGFITKLDVAFAPTNDEVNISGEIKFTGLPQVSYI